jgi:hypothetical protein
MKNFVALENHALEIPWWQDVVAGVPKPIIQGGHIAVPDAPGLGIELNDAVMKEHLRRPGYFEPTPQFDDFLVTEFQSGGPWPHYDADGNWCNCVSH